VGGLMMGWAMELSGWDFCCERQNRNATVELVPFRQNHDRTAFREFGNLGICGKVTPVDLPDAGRRGVAVQRTGDGRWGDTACPDGVTRASRGLGPMGVVLRSDRLRRVLSRRGPPPG